MLVRFRAAVVAAGGRKVCWGDVAGGWCSAGWGGQRVELLKRGFERFGPRPGGGEMQLGLAGGEREAGGDVHESVAPAFGFGGGELAVQAEGLGPDD